MLEVKAILKLIDILLNELKYLKNKSLGLCNLVTTLRSNGKIDELEVEFLNNLIHLNGNTRVGKKFYNSSSMVTGKGHLSYHYPPGEIGPRLKWLTLKIAEYTKIPNIFYFHNGSGITIITDIDTSLSIIKNGVGLSQTPLAYCRELEAEYNSIANTLNCNRSSLVTIRSKFYNIEDFTNHKYLPNSKVSEKIAKSISYEFGYSEFGYLVI